MAGLLPIRRVPGIRSPAPLSGRSMNFDRGAWPLQARPSHPPSTAPAPGQLRRPRRAPIGVEKFRSVRSDTPAGRGCPLLGLSPAGARPPRPRWRRHSQLFADCTRQPGPISRCRGSADTCRCGPRHLACFAAPALRQPFSRGCLSSSRRFTRLRRTRDARRLHCFGARQAPSSGVSTVAGASRTRDVAGGGVQPYVLRAV